MMRETEGGLLVASNFNFLRRFGRSKGRTRTIRMPNGEKAKVWINDARTVKQTERAESLDALVSPAPIRLVLPAHAAHALARRDATVSPGPIRTGLKVRKAN